MHALAASRSKVKPVLHAYPPPHFWILHIDGSAMPNPGRMGIGAVLTGPDGSCHHLQQTLPEQGCNNEAELRALQAGLDLLAQHGGCHLRIYTDSQWLLEQLAPSLVRKSVRPTLRLAPYLTPARVALAALAEVQWRWVPRHCNTEADALARRAAA